MNIANNLISKPYLGGVIILLAYVPGNQDIRHLRLAPRYVIQIRPFIQGGVARMYTVDKSKTVVSNYFPKSTVKLRHFIKFARA